MSLPDIDPILIVVSCICAVGWLVQVDGCDRSLEDRCSATCNRQMDHQPVVRSDYNVADYNDTTGLCVCRNGAVFHIRSAADMLRAGGR